MLQGPSHVNHTCEGWQRATSAELQNKLLDMWMTVLLFHCYFSTQCCSMQEVSDVASNAAFTRHWTARTLQCLHQPSLYWHLGVANQDFAQSRQITITMEFLFRHVIEHSEYIYIYSYKPFQQTFLFEMHNIYTLACLSTMFLGYLFRHCFAIFVPNFLEFLSLTFASLGNFCP